MLGKLLTSPSWLMVWFAIGLGATYAWTTGWLKEFRGHSVICISTLTVNYLIGFGLVGWMGWLIGQRATRRMKIKLNPIVSGTLGSVVVIFLFMFWLKLWGYELSFM